MYIQNYTYNYHDSNIYIIFREKVEKRYSNLVLCLFVGIQVFLDKTDIVNIYPAESTRVFLRLPTFCCRFKRLDYQSSLACLVKCPTFSGRFYTFHTLSVP